MVSFVLYKDGGEALLAEQLVDCVRIASEKSKPSLLPYWNAALSSKRRKLRNVVFRTEFPNNLILFISLIMCMHRIIIIII